MDLDYFKKYATQLTLEESTQPGISLRRGQLGALHSLAAHFTVRNDAAIVSLPTGYGKTAVVLGAPFILRCKRVLVVEPTNALRKQTYEQLEQLNPLKRLQVLPLATPLPVVIKVEEKLSSPSDWIRLLDANIVVSTPHCISPALAGVPPPPSDLFDLVLMDEGHHAAAPTWEALIRGFPSAKHVLVSATPFRADRQELPGKVIFHYPLKRAAAEGAFSKVVFQNVVPPDPADPRQTDVALAREAERIFLRDRANGFDHKMLIRVSSKVAAADTVEIYKAETTLRVLAAHSGLSMRRVLSIENMLRSGDLDGVVCVDMFGEGYDFPQLKIAVLHSPHQSLVPTLQFIGRFARTTGLKTGEATFLASRDDVATEGRRLYDDGVDWDTLLAAIADGNQLLEMSRQEALQSYEDIVGAAADYDGVTPGGVAIFKHVAIYECRDPPNLNTRCKSIGVLPVVKQWNSQSNHSTLLLIADIGPPRWSKQKAVIDARHDLFLLVYRPQSRRLFIAATLRKPGLYDSVVQTFTGGMARKLRFAEIKKVLSGVKNMVHHNVGAKNIAFGSPESYRIMAGSAADQTLDPGDARTYRQGHFMGRGLLRGQLETIGASSTSRTWGSGTLHIPEFLGYVADLDARLGSSAPIARSGLDVLPIGAALDQIPLNTKAANWPNEAWRDLPRVRIDRRSAPARFAALIDLEFSSFQVSAAQKTMRFEVGDDNDSLNLEFRLQATPTIVANGGATKIQVEVRENEWLPLEDWLSEHSPTFFTTDAQAFEGRENLGSQSVAGAVLRDDDVEVWQWQGCDVTVEFDLSDPRRPTVHRFLEGILLADSAHQVILYDHRSGELADYVTLKTNAQRQVCVCLYHCKGAGGATPSGERLADVSELVTQTIKSLALLEKDSILEHVKRRTAPTRTHKSKFIRGNAAQFQALLSATEPIDLTFEMFAVQPGIAKSLLAATLKEPMAAAISYINSVRAKCRLRWAVADRL